MKLSYSRSSRIDTLIELAEQGLRTVWGGHHAQRPRPIPAAAAPSLTQEDRELSAALMRVNHVGEVCAQALYLAQAGTTRNEALRAHFLEAAREEADHLAWTAERVAELGGRTSLLNPLWFAGAFTIGLIAGRSGDRRSLGFVIETERQVEQHLDSHLSRLPAADQDSRAIVTVMRDDEIRHARAAESAGGTVPPALVRQLMRLAAQVMTTTAHRI
jgi:3-demethoxyubiquinol 3-hydroxylase